MVSTDPELTNAPTMAAGSVPASVLLGKSGSVTPIPLSSTGGPVAPSRRGLTIAIAAGCAILGIAGAVMLVGGSRHDPGAGMVAPASAVPSQAPSATDPKPGPSATAPPAPTPAAPESAATAASAAPTVSTGPSHTAPAPTAHKIHAASNASATPAAPAKDCSTPYFFDPQGNKVFKPECLK
jgi:hypothetical protein